MPFKSDKQRRYMFAVHPRIAKRWAEEEKRHEKTRNSRREKKEKS